MQQNVWHKGGYFYLPKPLLYSMIWYNTIVTVKQLSDQCCADMSFYRILNPFYMHPIYCQKMKCISYDNVTSNYWL